MNNGGRVLVTGASGFVGSAVAKALVEAGYEVRALMRASSPREHLRGHDIEFAKGDLRDTDSIRHAMTGVRYVFHVAADYRLWAAVPEEISEVNVKGTETVMCAAKKAGVERIVYTSSVATLASRTDGIAVDETVVLDEKDAVGAYKRSKIAAERIVGAMAADGLPAIIVNPSTPVGPRDVRPTPTGRIIVECAAGRMPGFVDTGLNLVHVDDVAAGHLAALHKGKIGERYILGGQNVLLSDMLADISSIVGRTPPRWRLKHEWILPFAFGAELKARVTGREPFLTRDALRMAKHRMFFNAAKAERDLGYLARPYRQGLHDAIKWFREASYLK